MPATLDYKVRGPATAAVVDVWRMIAVELAFPELRTAGSWDGGPGAITNLLEVAEQNVPDVHTWQKIWISAHGPLRPPSDPAQASGSRTAGPAYLFWKMPTSTRGRSAR